MLNKLEIHPGAEDDVDIAYHWYEDQLSGLGETFLIELEGYYRKLEQNPEVHSKISRRLRQVIFTRFPYVLVYEIIKFEVHVYSVFHTSRNPKEKFKRK